MTDVLIKLGKFRHRRRKGSHEDGNRVWSYEATKQGMPRIASNHQKLEVARKDPPRGLQRQYALPMPSFQTSEQSSCLDAGFQTDKVPAL